MEGRQITYNTSLSVNEVIDYWQKRGEKGVICKLDIEKAYDNINWQFLMKVMQHMGFGPKWIRWIWWCVLTVTFSGLVNGVPAGFFPSSRGLRQGDPLSPYLFVLGMKVLSILLRRAVARGFLSGYSFRGNEGFVFNISHLLFADDNMVFCEVSEDQMLYLSWVLFWFEASSGLKINLEISELITVGRLNNGEVLVAELGCQIGSLPSTYLGLTLGAGHKAVTVWDSVEARMRKRLALWKRSFISKGGRNNSDKELFS